jgi:hypothetical protein
MHILTDLFPFVDTLCTKGVQHAKQTSFYERVASIVNHETERPVYGIPYHTLFDDEGYVERIIRDKVTSSITYDSNAKCFVFSSMKELFDGIVVMFQEHLTDYPNDRDIANKLQRIQQFMSLVDASMEADALCKELCDVQI